MNGFPELKFRRLALDANKEIIVRLSRGLICLMSKNFRTGVTLEDVDAINSMPPTIKEVLPLPEKPKLKSIPEIKETEPFIENMPKSAEKKYTEMQIRNQIIKEKNFYFIKQMRMLNDFSTFKDRYEQEFDRLQFLFNEIRNLVERTMEEQKIKTSVDSEKETARLDNIDATISNRVLEEKIFLFRKVLATVGLSVDKLELIQKRLDDNQIRLEEFIKDNQSELENKYGNAGVFNEE